MIKNVFRLTLKNRNEGELNKVVETVESLMREYINSLGDSTTDSLYEKIPGGKRLRAKLILKIAKGHQDAPKLGAIVELIHAASLLHDDVIDDALTRRGKESINALFGNKTAIMLGDILYSKGFFELSKMPSAIAQVISNAVTQLSVGELLDIELAKSFNEDKESYYNMIYKKTASLIEAAACAAALLVGKDEQKFALYGKNLGLAFQIVDDILDITQDSATLGKPALNDFVEGKTTLPYIYMYEQLGGEDKEKLKSLFAKELSDEESTWVKKKMQETKAIEKSVKEAKKLGYEALKTIEDEGIEGLDGVILQMIEREF